MSFHITVGEASNVVIRHSNKSTPIICKALLIEYNANGQPTHLILDRLIPNNIANKNDDEWTVAGCFVSELIRKN